MDINDINKWYIYNYAICYFKIAFFSESRAF